MAGKAPRGRGRGRGAVQYSPYPTAPQAPPGYYPNAYIVPSAADSLFPADRSITTLTIEGIGPDSGITKKDIIPALGDYAGDVITISLRPLRAAAVLTFNSRASAESVFGENLGWLTVAGKKYALGWDLAQHANMDYTLPPPPPSAFPVPDIFSRAGSRGLGRGTYDPQFRQMGHFMDTSQLVEGPNLKAVVKGIHKKKA